MIEFRFAEHSHRNAQVVEVWAGSKLLGTIYPTDTGIRILTKHFDDIVRGDSVYGIDDVAVIKIQFKDV